MITPEKGYKKIEKTKVATTGDRDVLAIGVKNGRVVVELDDQELLLDQAAKFLPSLVIDNNAVRDIIKNA